MVPTVIINTPNGPVVINQSEFDPATMTLHDGSQPVAPALRSDGPTIAEWITDGYPPENYPPQGYAARSTPEEIDAAIAAAKPPLDDKPPVTPAPAPQMAVTKKGRKFIVVDANGGAAIERDGIAADGYGSEADAWAAIMAIAATA